MNYADRSPVSNLAADLAAQGDDEHDRALQAARATFAGQYEIIETFGGFAAVPTGVTIVNSTTLDALVGKLRALEDSNG